MLTLPVLHHHHHNNNKRPWSAVPDNDEDDDNCEDNDDNNDDSDEAASPDHRRQRLQLIQQQQALLRRPLTSAERRTLRNRLSAQRSRDNKKARMSFLETENARLSKSNGALQAENAELRRLLQVHMSRADVEQQQQQQQQQQLSPPQDSSLGSSMDSDSGVSPPASPLPGALSPSSSTASSASLAAVVPTLDDDDEAALENGDGVFDVSCLLADEPSTASHNDFTNDTEPAALFSLQMEAFVFVMWMLWWTAPFSTPTLACSKACPSSAKDASVYGSQPSLMAAIRSTTGRGPVWSRPRQSLCSAEAA